MWGMFNFRKYNLFCVFFFIVFSSCEFSDTKELESTSKIDTINQIFEIIVFRNSFHSVKKRVFIELPINSSLDTNDTYILDYDTPYYKPSFHWELYRLKSDTLALLKDSLPFAHTDKVYFELDFIFTFGLSFSDTRIYYKPFFESIRSIKSVDENVVFKPINPMAEKFYYKDQLVLPEDSLFKYGNYPPMR